MGRGWIEKLARNWIDWRVDPVNETKGKISRKEWRFRSGNELRWPRTSAVPLQSGNPAQSDSLALPVRLKNRAEGLPPLLRLFLLLPSLWVWICSPGYTPKAVATSSNDHLVTVVRLRDFPDLDKNQKSKNKFHSTEGVNELRTILRTSYLMNWDLYYLKYLNLY